MTIFVYSNNGTSFRMEATDYVIQAGEVSFTNYATPEQLAAAFPNYAAMEAALTTAQVKSSAAASAISAGVTITSSSTPAVNGIYSCDQNSVANFANVELYVMKNATFPGPSSVRPWLTLDNRIVVIPNTTVFGNIATAIADYVAQVMSYAYGEASSLPSSAIIID